MQSIFERHGGEARILTNRKFLEKQVEAIEMLSKSGIEMGIKKTSDGSELVEKTGLISLIGAMVAVDEGIIDLDESVLIAFTGGTRQPEGEFTPKFIVSSDDTDRQLIQIGEKLDLS